MLLLLHFFITILLYSNDLHITTIIIIIIILLLHVDGGMSILATRLAAACPSHSPAQPTKLSNVKDKLPEIVMRKTVAPLTYVLSFSLCVLSLSSAKIDTVNSTVQRVAYDGSSDPDNKDVSVHQVTCEDYFDDKLNMKEMNRKPTYKDFFHLSNIIVGEEYPANEESSDLSDKNGPAFIIAMKDVQFDLTVNRLKLSAKDQRSSSKNRSVNVLLPWDTNHMVTNSKGVRSRRATSEKDDDNVNEYGGEPTLKLNGFDFVGFAFKAPLVPSIVFSDEANIQIGDFLSARAICKLFANHGYAVKSPSLSLHAHRVYGEELKINPGRLFDTIEGNAADISGVDTFGFVTA